MKAFFIAINALGLIVVLLGSENPRNWSTKIIENEVGILKVDEALYCKDTSKCRKWDDILNTAMCKANKFEESLNSRLKEGVSVYYTQTVSKDLREEGWSKFLFNIFKKNDHEDPANRLTFKAAHLFKVCVPTKKEVLSWISPFCALDECGEIPSDEKTKCVNEAVEGGEAIMPPPSDSEMRFSEEDEDLLRMKASVESRYQTEEGQNTKGKSNELLSEKMSLDFESLMKFTLEKLKSGKLKKIEPDSCSRLA